MGLEKQHMMVQVLGLLLLVLETSIEVLAPDSHLVVVAIWELIQEMEEFSLTAFLSQMNIYKMAMATGCVCWIRFN